MGDDSAKYAGRLHEALTALGPDALASHVSELKVPNVVDGRPVAGMLPFSRVYSTLDAFLSALRGNGPGAAEVALELFGRVAPARAEGLAREVLESSWPAGRDRALAALAASPSESAFSTLLAETKKGTKLAGTFFARSAFDGGCTRVREELDRLAIVRQWRPFEQPTAAAMAGKSAEEQRSVWAQAQTFDAPQVTLAADLLAYLGNHRCEASRDLLVELFRAHPALWYHAGLALQHFDDAEALELLAGGLDKADVKARALAVESIFRRDAKGAYDRLHVDALLADGSPLLDVVLRALIEDTMATRRPTRGFLRADPRWLDVALALEKHKTQGQSAKYFLTQFPADEVSQARARVKKGKGASSGKKR